MSKVTYLDPIKSMHGKLHSQSDTWLNSRSPMPRKPFEVTSSPNT